MRRWGESEETRKLRLSGRGARERDYVKILRMKASSVLRKLDRTVPNENAAEATDLATEPNGRENRTLDEHTVIRG